MIGAVRATLILLALSAVGAGVYAAVAAPPPPIAPLTTTRPAASPMHPVAAAARADSLLTMVAGRAPFRPSRRAASQPYDPETAGAPPNRPPKPPKPAPVLAGIVWAESPAAALEGVPGVDGARVVARGDTVGGLTVRRISREQVVVVGYDTTWVLKLKEPWR